MLYFSLTLFFFFFNDTATTEIYTLSLHDALPICGVGLRAFKPIWRSYTRKVEQFGYVHRHAELETFNREAFSCPKCDASERDRLMAIFLDRILPSLAKGGGIRLTDFAPSDPLSR